MVLVLLLLLRIIKQTTTTTTRFPRVHVDIPFLRDVGGAPAIDDGKVKCCFEHVSFLQVLWNSSFYFSLWPQKKETKRCTSTK